MHDLTAQVTSSLLPFPSVTIEALGEDEIILDSVLHGNFTIGEFNFTDHYFIMRIIFSLHYSLCSEVKGFKKKHITTTHFKSKISKLNN